VKYRVIKDCKTREEAIAKSGLHIGQPARIVGLIASGNIDGQWTVMPEFEVMDEINALPQVETKDKT